MQLFAKTFQEMEKEQFRFAETLIHWDGQLLKDLTGRRELVDRLPIILSGSGVNHLLVVPKLYLSTDEAQASVVVRLLEKWEVALGQSIFHVL